MSRPDANVEKYTEEIYRGPDDRDESVAYSTLPPSEQQELAQIYELKESLFTSREAVRQRMWLHDMLDDNNVQYKIVILGKWKSRRKFRESQLVYVGRENEKKVLGLIKKFKRAKRADMPEEYAEDGLPQVKCGSCGREFDFDHHKCPHCGVHKE